MCGHTKFVLLNGANIPYSLGADWILRHGLKLNHLIEEGKISPGISYGFTISAIHLFPDWRLLTNNPDYARQIVIESKKLDYKSLCSDFKIVLQACYDTLSKVALPVDTDEEIVATSEIKNRELVTA
jgi:hypothetical protein